MGEYTETPKKARWVSALVAFAVLAMLAALYGILSSTTKTTGPALAVVVLAMGMAGYALFTLYRMQYRISQKGLEVRFPPFSYKVAKSDIVSVTVRDAPWFMGVGIRLGINRIAFTTRTGRIVDVEKASGHFRHVWLTPDDPDAFAGKLR